MRLRASERAGLAERRRHAIPQTIVRALLTVRWIQRLALIETPCETTGNANLQGILRSAQDDSVGDYFCATSSLARVNSGRVELEPSQTLSRSA
jgi:hypothetical protein